MQKQRSSHAAAAAARSPPAAAALRSSAASSFAFTCEAEREAGPQAVNGLGVHAAQAKGGRHADMLLPPQQCCNHMRLRADMHTASDSTRCHISPRGWLGIGLGRTLLRVAASIARECCGARGCAARCTGCWASGSERPSALAPPPSPKGPAPAVRSHPTRCVRHQLSKPKILPAQGTMRALRRSQTA